MVIIGICGQKRHGKDTIANYLVDKYGFIKMSYAQPIKDICEKLFHFNGEQLDGKLKETIDDVWGFTPRQAFQFIGTDLFRDQFKQLSPNIGEDIWAFRLNQEINLALSNSHQTQHICISDVRFDNEIKLLRECAKKNNTDCVIINVKRIQLLSDLGSDVGSDLNPINPNLKVHRSEQGVSIGIDYYVLNETIEKLYLDIDQMLATNKLL